MLRLSLWLVHSWGNGSRSGWLSQFCNGRLGIDGLRLSYQSGYNSSAAIATAASRSCAQSVSSGPGGEDRLGAWSARAASAGQATSARHLRPRSLDAAARRRQVRPGPTQPHTRAAGEVERRPECAKGLVLPASPWTHGDTGYQQCFPDEGVRMTELRFNLRK